MCIYQSVLYNYIKSLHGNKQPFHSIGEYFNVILLIDTQLELQVLVSSPYLGFCFI